MENKESPPQNGDCKVRFKREIGLLEGTSITLGCIIGSGIFIAPKGIVASVGSVGLSLLVWVLSGVLASIGAICYTELGTAFPSSGGDYYYLYEAFGPLPAFLYLWTAMMIFVPCNNAILSLSFAQYVLQPLFPSECGNAIPDSAIRLIAAIAICVLTFISCYDARATAKLQNVFTFSKLVALVSIIITGLYAIWARPGGASNFNNAFEGSNTDPGSIALAFYSGIFAFSGANALNSMVEEVKSPSKTLPRSIYISMTIIIVVYLAANAAYFVAMSPMDMLNSEAVAVTFGEKTMGSYSFVISIFVAISTFGGLAVSTIMSSRILFSGARYGHFPKMLAHLQYERLTPISSLIFLGFLSLAYLCTSNVHTLINYAGFLWALVAVGVAASVIYLRYTHPNQPRPVKVPIVYPILYFVLSLFLFLLPIYVAPMQAAIGFLITLTGLPVYFLFVKPEKRPLWLEDKLESISIVLQKLFLSMPTE